MRVGEIIDVFVVAVNPYGLDVEAQGIPGFVQPTEVSWDAAVSPTEVTRVGAQLPVKIIAVAPDRFSASVRQADPGSDPWAVPVTLGSTHSGVVEAVHDWGVFVRIRPGMAGLVDWAGLPPSPGGEVRVVVLSVDVAARRLKLAPAEPTEARCKGH